MASEEQIKKVEDSLKEAQKHLGAMKKPKPPSAGQQFLTYLALIFILAMFAAANSP